MKLLHYTLQYRQYNFSPCDTLLLFHCLSPHCGLHKHHFSSHIHSFQLKGCEECYLQCKGRSRTVQPEKKKGRQTKDNFLSLKASSQFSLVITCNLTFREFNFMATSKVKLSNYLRKKKKNRSCASERTTFTLRKGFYNDSVLSDKFSLSAFVSSSINLHLNRMLIFPLNPVSVNASGLDSGYLGLLHMTLTGNTLDYTV